MEDPRCPNCPECSLRRELREYVRNTGRRRGDGALHSRGKTMKTVNEYLVAMEAVEDETTDIPGIDAHDKLARSRWTGFQVAEQYVDNLADDNETEVPDADVIAACERAIETFETELAAVPAGEFFDGRRERVKASIGGATTCLEIARNL